MRAKLVARVNGGPGLTQVAVIVASCCVGHICMVGGGGGCSCMLLLHMHPVPTSTDEGPDLCTLCPNLCTLHPDLWTLCLWCFPSFHRWWSSSVATCTGGAFSFSHWRKYCICNRATCTVWQWFYLINYLFRLVV